MIRVRHSEQELGREVHPERQALDALLAQSLLHVVRLRIVRCHPAHAVDVLVGSLEREGHGGLSRAGVLDLR